MKDRVFCRSHLDLAIELGLCISYAQTKSAADVPKFEGFDPNMTNEVFHLLDSVTFFTVFALLTSCFRYISLLASTKPISQTIMLRIVKFVASAVTIFTDFFNIYIRLHKRYS